MYLSVLHWSWPEVKELEEEEAVEVEEEVTAEEDQFGLTSINIDILLPLLTCNYITANHKT